jgi:hypothetical protein
VGGLKNLIQKYTSIAKELPEQRQKLALIYAHDAYALTQDRLVNDGVNARGQKFKPYSESNIAHKLKPSNYMKPQIVVKFKKDAQQGKNNGSYRAFRQAYGRPTDKRTHNVDNNMLQSISQYVVFHDEYKTIVEIRPKDKETKRKVDANSRIVNINILAFGKDEKDFLAELNRERLNNLLR